MTRNLACVHHLVGVAEIAQLLGVTKQRVGQIEKTDPTFPAPEAILSAGKIWKREAVEKWAKERGRLA